MLAGDQQVYYCCEKCKENTAATLYMRIHRFPRILQLHIKRFKYAGAPLARCPPRHARSHGALLAESCSAGGCAGFRDSYGTGGSGSAIGPLHKASLITPWACYYYCFCSCFYLYLNPGSWRWSEHGSLAWLGAGVTREKLTDNVNFPLKGLKLSAYASDECHVEEGAAECDLSPPAVPATALSRLLSCPCPAEGARE